MKITPVRHWIVLNASELQQSSMWERQIVRSTAAKNQQPCLNRFPSPAFPAVILDAQIPLNPRRIALYQLFR